MTVKSDLLRDGQRVEKQPPRGPSLYQPIAIVIWLLACVTTWQLVAAVAPEMRTAYQIAIGVGLQAIFTVLESPVLRGKPTGISIAVIGIDALVNAGGIFAYALKLGSAPTAQMVATTFSLAPQMTPGAAFGVSLVLGALLAAAPEAVWRWRG